MSLRRQLESLEAAGLIRLAAAEPEPEYMFRHALVQDAAYATLVKAERQGLHRAVGEALESVFPDRLRSRDLAPWLGRHFLEAGDRLRAAPYFVFAGDEAFGTYANAEAAAHYSQAIQIIKRLPASGQAGVEQGEADAVQRLSLER